MNYSQEASVHYDYLDSIEPYKATVTAYCIGGVYLSIIQDGCVFDKWTGNDNFIMKDKATILEYCNNCKDEMLIEDFENLKTNLLKQL